MGKLCLNICVVVGVVWLLIQSKYGREQQSSTEQPAKAEPSPEPTAQQKAKEARYLRDVLAIRQLRAGMKNPDSFKLEEVIRMADGTLCLTYRATNSFNAVIPGYAVIASNKINTSDDRDAFTPIWNRRCANKSGEDLTYIRRAL